MSTGAHTVVERLIAGGVDVCFANPGTSEMHFVAALDSAPQMRAVLCPFEGVATGAADGYARIAGKPAATLLHLGPGMANGLANLHNARRARTPLVNIVGDHATYHSQYDAPLQSDIHAAASNVSGWIRRPERPAEAGGEFLDQLGLGDDPVELGRELLDPRTGLRPRARDAATQGNAAGSDRQHVPA